MHVLKLPDPVWTWGFLRRSRTATLSNNAVQIHGLGADGAFRVGLVCHDEGVKAAGPEEALIHLVQKAVGALPLLQFNGRAYGHLDNQRGYLEGVSRHKTDDGGGQVDDVEDGGGLRGLRPGLEHVEKGGLGDISRALMIGGIGADEATAFGARARRWGRMTG